jgi:hypothetical protein
MPGWGCPFGSPSTGGKSLYAVVRGRVARLYSHGRGAALVAPAPHYRGEMKQRRDPLPSSATQPVGCATRSSPAQAPSEGCRTLNRGTASSRPLRHLIASRTPARVSASGRSRRHNAPKRLGELTVPRGGTFWTVKEPARHPVGGYHPWDLLKFIFIQK